jgi:hypothetical protein
VTERNRPARHRDQRDQVARRVGEVGQSLGDRGAELEGHGLVLTARARALQAV